MKILVAQLNFKVGDFENNLPKIIRAIQWGKEKGAEIVLFSELALCGGFPHDLLLRRDFIFAIEHSWKEILPHCLDVMVVVGTPRRHANEMLNSAMIIQEGTIIGFSDKKFLSREGDFQEICYFNEGQRGISCWQWKGKKIAVCLGENRGLGEQACQGSRWDLILNLSILPYRYDAFSLRMALFKAIALHSSSPLVVCNAVGGNDHSIFDGYSLFLDQEGKCRQCASGFQEDLMMVNLSSFPQQAPSEPNSLEDLYNALVLGVRDYFHKQNFGKAILGLSGGIDSAVVACIAIDALGKNEVTALLMPSEYSSKKSVEDAQVLASRLEIRWELLSITPIYQLMLKVLFPFFHGSSFDHTEENLQARIRGMLLMALANKWGCLVLNTGNKSEASVGYCTLYGDMVGGIGVLGDVSKGMVYRLAEWINRDGERIPLSILTKEPSAELKWGQTDRDSLPEYAVLDLIVKSYVEDLLSPEEITSLYSFPNEEVMKIIHRIDHFEYKRRQAPPYLRVTKRGFGTGRTYPIVWGSF